MIVTAIADRGSTVASALSPIPAPVCGELLISPESAIRHTQPPGSRTPTPKQAEALTVPLDHCCWLDQHHHLQTAWPQSVEPDPEQAIDREQPEPTRPLAAKDVQLVTEREVL